MVVGVAVAKRLRDIVEMARIPPKAMDEDNQMLGLLRRRLSGLSQSRSHVPDAKECLPVDASKVEGERHLFETPEPVSIQAPLPIQGMD